MGFPCDADESLLRQGLQHRDQRPFCPCSEHATRRDAGFPPDAHSQFPLQPRFRYAARRTRQTYQQRGQRKWYLEWYKIIPTSTVPPLDRLTTETQPRDDRETATIRNFRIVPIRRATARLFLCKKQKFYTFPP